MSKLDSLEPEFKAKIEQLLEIAKDVTGRTWVVTAGRRTMAEQTAIYAQGRTAPGKVVSNAPAGSSAHNYGLAADLAPLKEGSKTIDWGADRVLWENMADAAVEMGLEAGCYFRSIMDMPHVQSPDWKTAQSQWKAGKLKII